MISMKDIVEINREFHEGRIINGSSLEYAVKTQARSKNWLKSAAHFTRAVLIDHAFEDGNKRTTATIIMMIMDLNKINYNPQKIADLVLKTVKKNITNLREIERNIKNGIR